MSRRPGEPESVEVGCGCIAWGETSPQKVSQRPGEPESVEVVCVGGLRGGGNLSPRCLRGLANLGVAEVVCAGVLRGRGNLSPRRCLIGLANLKVLKFCAWVYCVGGETSPPEGVSEAWRI